MKKTTKILAVAAFAIFAGTAVYAGPHHHHGRRHHHVRHDGVHLATGIVRLVGATLNPFVQRPVVVTPRAPIVITPVPYYCPPLRYYRPLPPPPPPRRHHHHNRHHRGRGGHRR